MHFAILRDPQGSTLTAILNAHNSFWLQLNLLPEIQPLHWVYLVSHSLLEILIIHFSILIVIESVIQPIKLLLSCFNVPMIQVEAQLLATYVSHLLLADVLKGLL
jgi:hypothetical protein